MTTLFTGPLDATCCDHAKLRTLSQSDVQLADGFWKHRQAVSRNVSLPHGWKMLVKAMNLANLKMAGDVTYGRQKDKPKFHGPVFMDSDLYKWLEAAALELGNEHDPLIAAHFDEAIEVLENAQAPDGYLNSYFQAIEPQSRWKRLGSDHELYCAGHLFQAAVAHFRATGSKRLINIARRFADCIDLAFGPGPDQLKQPCGHPEIETALVELYRATLETRYLRLAEFFLNQRGRKSLTTGSWIFDAVYLQDHLPIREQTTAVGHAVRQLYLAAGITDLYLQTGEKALLDAQKALFQEIESGKTFVTGGFGSRPGTEAFGKPFELPNETCYCETCAAIAMIFWSFRMLLATGEHKYAEAIERSLFNAVLSGVSLDGSRFFYENPLLSRGGIQRPEWYGCACCPPNAMRLFASIGQYLATRSWAGVQIQQFAPATLQTTTPGGRKVQLRMETQYPWDGKIRLTVDAVDAGVETPWELAVRIPLWAQSAVGKSSAAQIHVVDGYARATHDWKAGDSFEVDLKLEPRQIVGHPYVESTTGCVALAYGPMIYCIEQPDQEADVLSLRIDPDAALATAREGDLLGGVVTIHGSGDSRDFSKWKGMLYMTRKDAPTESRPAKLKAIPYYAWANRGGHAMRVWIPTV